MNGHLMKIAFFACAFLSLTAYPKSWTGPWTLDSGLWTLDSGLWTFPPKTPPEKNLYIYPPIKLPSPQKNSFPQTKNSTTSDFFLINMLEVCEISNKQRYSPPPTHLPEKSFMSPLKTASSQKVPLPSPKLKIQLHRISD